VLVSKSETNPPRIAVSVVVPAYMVAKEIDLCLSSLASQSLNSLEVLVINDGSPDDTGAKALAWEEKFPGRISVLNKANGGCASARAAGLRAAQGEFVGFVDGDDWVDPPMFEALYRAAKCSGADIAQCGFGEAFSDGTRTPSNDPLERSGELIGDIRTVDDPLTLLPLRPTIWRRIYRRDFLLGNEIKFPEHIRRFDDLPFQFETFVCANRVAVVPEVYYAYRQDRPGQDIAVRDERFFVHFEIFDWLENWLDHRNNRAVERQLFRAEVSSHIWALSRIEKGLKQRYFRMAVGHLGRPRRFLGMRDKLAMGRSVSPAALRLVIYSLLRPSLTHRERKPNFREAAIEIPKADSLQR
jgi:glycosyltransferase involved in cell wall biosynthesis